MAPDPARRRPCRALSALVALALLAALPGCAALSDAVLGPEVAINQISITAAPNANDDSPTTVDVVLLYDDSLTDQFLQMTAAQWFDRREQLTRDFPNGIQVFSWEVVPGQTLSDLSVDRRAGTTAGFVFARFTRPAPHRLRLTDQSTVEVRLMEHSFSLVAEGSS
jgi:type VI secretion system protein